MGSTICVRCGANLMPHSYCNVCHGFWLEEFTSPYYEFIDNGYEVTLASPKGGKPPVDPKSLAKENQSESTQRFEKDESAQKRLENTVEPTHG